MFKQITFLLILIFFTLGIYIGVRIGSGKVKIINKYFSEFKEVRQKGTYKFVSPLLECDANAGTDSTEFEVYKRKLATFIDEKIEEGKVDEVGFYYRDLNNGPSFGINSDIAFAPSSLFKVPVMMAYFKEAEENPSILQKKILFQEKVDISQQPIYSKDTSLTLGQEYTVMDLIERMIQHSDNQALFLLRENISQDKIDQVTKDLGVTTPDNTTPENFLTVKSYSSLFRILFNASYIKQDYSEKELEILSKVEFNNALTAGIPKGTLIAHKFGEGEIEDGVKQLHDCGIIYYPGHPYLICVMTRGSDYKTQADFIKEVSHRLYSEIDRRYKK